MFIREKNERDFDREKPSLQKISMTARPTNIRRIASLAQ